MAAYYNRNRARKQGSANRSRLATAEAQPKNDSTARFKPTWCQLRFRMEMADELHLFWMEMGGQEPALEEEIYNSAAPIESSCRLELKVTPLGGTLIDPQLIALNRSIPVTAPAIAPKVSTPGVDLPMLRLEQLTYGQMYRLAGARA